MKIQAIVVLLLFPLFLVAQFDDKSKNIRVPSVKNQFVIDGVLNEEIWSTLLPATDFWQYFPTDSLLAEAQTEIYLARDETNLYVGIKCYSSGNNWLVNSLKRDYRAGGNDNVTLVFDSFDDQTNGLFFGINPQGVIREGVVTNGGNGFRDFSTSWDNKWKGESRIYDGYFTAELAIPFSTLRYDSDSQKWGLLVYRFDTQTNETSVWKRIPRNQTLFSLAYTGSMVWEEPLDAKSNNISLIPFVTAGVSKDFEENLPSSSFADIGGDLKVGITSGLNLDVTINPDFSQVEVDRQITNLDRFEIFFPERRQFFIENADLFGSFGFASINPFFSRRIGVGKNSDGSTVQNRIYGGLRLSGKINKDTRVGLLNMQTAQDNDQGLANVNYSVAVLQKKILDRSNIGFILINKQSFGDNVERFELSPYNRVAGLDFNYATADNTWSGKTFLHSAFNPSISPKFSHGTELSYSKRTFEFTWSHEYVMEDYNAEVGFVRRTNYYKIEPEIRFTKYPVGDVVNEIGLQIDGEVFWRPGFGRTDHSYGASLRGQLTNGSRFFMGINHNYIYLFDSFDPTGSSSDPLAAETSYNFINFRGSISSDRRKKFSGSINPFFGEYFNGWRTGVSGNLTFRYQPKGSIDLTYAWNLFDMPHLDEVKQTLLIGPRIDYTFSKSLFATAFIQYNTQSKNTNINTRIQWRFAPVSDFFLVFTDNYFTGNLEDPSDRFSINLKNRAVVAKLTYWINV